MREMVEPAEVLSQAHHYLSRSRESWAAVLGQYFGCYWPSAISSEIPDL
jgi:hypothetical protein